MRFLKVSPTCRSVCNVTLASSVAALTAACSQTGYHQGSVSGSSVDRPFFTESEYGVSTSRRVVTSGPVPKGGGTYKVGSPYKVAGRWYVPREDPYYDRVGISSWYGDDFHGRRTSNGEIFDRRALSAAHPTLPLPSYAYVTNLDNGRTILVRVNDRGPYVRGRIIDLSHASASALGFVGKGSTRVRVRYAGRAPLNGDDRHERRYLAEQQRNNWRGTQRQFAAYRPPPQEQLAYPPTRQPDRQSDRQPARWNEEQGGWSPSAYRANLAGRPEPRDVKPEIHDKYTVAYRSDAYRAPRPEPYALAGPPPSAIAPRAAEPRRAFVDVGLYRDIDKAERLRREFGHLGPVEVAPLESRNGAAVYRVRLGPMSPGAAESAYREVSARGLSGSTITFE